MIGFELTNQQSSTATSPLPVTVIGVGGAGSNVLDTIALDGLPDARLLCLNTDVRALQNSMAGTKIQLGRDLTQGLGAGGDPELGAEAARLSVDEIRGQVLGQQIIFMCVGLGGGTGSGAAPLVARVAREAGAFVVVFALMPFSFEGKRRVRQARGALEALRHQASALITFDNDRIGELVLPKKGIQDAFTAADRVVSQSIRALINFVTQPGLIRIGMDDLITALRNHNSRCLFGYGLAGGDNRAIDALRIALKSPLLDREQLLKNVRNVLVHVCGGPQMTFFEVEELMESLGTHLQEDAQILFGTGTDPRMGDQISVTILTSLGKPEESEAGAQPLTPSSSTPLPDALFALPVVPASNVAVSPGPLPMEDYGAGDAREPLIDDPTSIEEQSDAEWSERSPGPGRTEVAAQDFAAFETSESDPADPELAAMADTTGSEDDTAGEDAGQMEVAHDTPVLSTFEETEMAASLEPESYFEPEVGQPLLENSVADEDEQDGSDLPSEDSTLEEEKSHGPPKPVERSAPLPNPFRLRDVAWPKAGPVFNEDRSKSAGRPQIFQSWRREQARINSLPPQPPEKVEPVSDFEERHESVPADPPPPPVRPASRLPFLPGAQKEDGPRPGGAAQEQATFDESLTPASRGRFDKVEPTIEDGQDLDVPAFLRRRRK